MTETKKPSVVKRIFILLLVTVLLVAAAGYGGLYVLLKGPSEYAGALFTVSLAEQPAGNVLLHLFLSDEEIAQRVQTVQDEWGGTERQFSVYPQLG